MRRLEIIHLRWTTPHADDVIAELRGTIEGLVGPGRVEIYRHAAVPTDVGIFLRHEPGADEADLAALGLHIVAALQGKGMVEHSIWLAD